MDFIKFYFASFLDMYQEEIGVAIISAYSLEEARTIANGHPTAEFIGVEPLNGDLIKEAGYIVYEANGCGVCDKGRELSDYTN